MSLYSMIGSGTSPLVPVLVQIIMKTQKIDLPFFRDAWLSNSGREIIVVLKVAIAGIMFNDQFSALLKHPLYLRCEPESSRPEYSEFHFQVPRDIEAATATIHRLYYGGKTWTMQTTLDMTLESLKNGHTNPVRHLNATQLTELTEALETVYHAVVDPHYIETEA